MFFYSPFVYPIQFMSAVQKQEAQRKINYIEVLLKESNTGISTSMYLFLNNHYICITWNIAVNYKLEDQLYPPNFRFSHSSPTPPPPGLVIYAQ